MKQFGEKKEIDDVGEKRDNGENKFCEKVRGLVMQNTSGESFEQRRDNLIT